MEIEWKDQSYNFSMLTCRITVLLYFLALPLLVAQDATVLGAIKDQAVNHSQAVEDVFYLADVFGPRFMDSPGFVKAGDWAVERLKTYGLANVAKEYFTTPGPGWGFSGVSVEMISPAYSRMGAFPLARSKSTNGVVSGEPVLAAITTEQELQRFVARYRNGSIVTSDLGASVGPRWVKIPLDPSCRRLEPCFGWRCKNGSIAMPRGAVIEVREIRRISFRRLNGGTA